jgi:hypothetical protein
MKKLTLRMSAVAALVAATIGFAAPAVAAPGYELADCSVHVVYQGADVGVNWC